MLSPINSAADVYLILGDPVEQVRAPEVFNLIFQTLGMDAVMVPVQVPAAGVRDFVRAAFSARNIKGLLLTIVHKSLVMNMLGECSELGRLAGAVNAVRCDTQGRLAGELFDGVGLVSSLNAFNICYTGKRVLLLGAGGGAAIAASLVSPASAASKGAAAEVALYDPTPGKAQALARRLGAGGPAQVMSVASSDPAGFDVVVNASPLGLQAADPLPCDVSRMAPEAALVDILMKNHPTLLVRAARTRGLAALIGFEMLIQQEHLYLRFFGLHDAARAVQSVQSDAHFIRQAIYPAELMDEIALF